MDFNEMTETYKSGGPSEDTPSARMVHEFRLKHQISQATLARLLGVTTATVQHWERGRRRPRPLGFLETALQAAEKKLAQERRLEAKNERRDIAIEAARQKARMR